MRLLTALLATMLTTGVFAAPVNARVCRDIRGKIVKCRPVVTPPPPGCRDTRGHLIPCPANPNERTTPHKAGPAPHR